MFPMHFQDVNMLKIINNVNFSLLNHPFIFFYKAQLDVETVVSIH